MYILLLLNARIKNPHKYAQEKPKKKIQYSEETYGIPVLNCLDIDIFTESVPLRWNFTVIYYQLPLIKCPKRDILQIHCPETNEIARSIRFVNSIPSPHPSKLWIFDIFGISLISFCGFFQCTYWIIEHILECNTSTPNTHLLF